MVQVMSFDIKIHQISIDSKDEQCFDFIASDKGHYHLKCRKYSGNSGDNENILCFSHFIQLWFKLCPLTSKFIKFQLIASTSSVLTSLCRTKFSITNIVVNFLTIRVIMKIYYVLPSHPAMVQVMSFDIKIHQISIDGKHKQCFDFIASNKVHYHLYCHKYSD